MSYAKTAAAREALSRRLDRVPPGKAERPIMTARAPWGDWEHFVDGVQTTATAAFRARARRWFGGRQ